VDREEPAERVSRQNAIRLHPVGFFDFRDQLCLEKLQEVVGAAGSRKLQHAGRILLRGLVRRQVTSAISVRNANDDHFRNPTVARQKLNSARGVAYMSVAVGHVEYRITFLVRFIPDWSTHQHDPVFAQDR
jgi:hypothetical protein